MARRTNKSVIDSNAMRWEPLEVEGSTGKAWIKTLAKDDATGGRTALVKFDPGYKQETAVSNLPVDMYVLEGEMQAAELNFQPDTFHYRPAGTEYGPIDSPKGIVRLVFVADSGLPSGKEPVFIADIKQMPIGRHALDPEGKQRGARQLRMDPNGTTSIRVHETWEVGFRGLQGVHHVHDHSEEYFVVTGQFWDYLEDIDGHVLNSPGFYGCRPGGESSHGDTCTVLAPSKLIVRHEHSTSKASMDAAQYAKDMEIHSPTHPVEAVRFVE